MKNIVLLVCFVFASSLPSFAAKKVLFIDSYHEGYAWSDDITRGVKKTLEGKAELKIFRMDTKRNGTEDFKKASGEKAKAVIEEFKPDVVVVSDDNAAKYVIVPFYMNAALPFVFCGLNWDASGYGFPCKNVTGMVEVSMYQQQIDQMKIFAKGSRLSFLGATTETDKKEVEYSQKVFGLTYAAVKHVGTFDEWKAAFVELQNQSDMMIVVNFAGIKGWNDAEAKKFAEENTKIPTSSSHDFVAPFVLIDYAKLGEEQGAWAAQTALKIMDGTKIAAIPVEKNKQGQLFLNMAIAKKLGVTFKPAMLKNAKVVQ